MMARLRDESGFSLVELLTVLVLVVIVMSATLTAFAQFEQTTGTNQKQNEAQDAVRVGLAGVSRELRNLASPTPELPEAIVRATATDLIFQSVSSNNTRRVRYCLDTTRKRLWRQLDPAPFGAIADATCPTAVSGWGTNTVAASNVVNGTRDVFGYNVAGDPDTAANRARITEISSTLWVDVNPGVRPLETSLQTSIFLRNQNRNPVASFTANVNGSSIVLNGAQSSDPEGRSLRFFWYDTGVSSSAACGTLPTQVPQTGCVGTNVVYTYTPATAGVHNVYLVVADPATLISQASTKAVCIPTVTTPCATP